MSARFAGDSIPDPLGQNHTSSEVSNAVCSWLQNEIDWPERILEPSAGLGAFVTSAKNTWAGAHITSVEIDQRLPAPHDSDEHIFSDYLQTDLKGFNLVLGNPPYGVETGRYTKRGKPIMRSAWEDFVVHAAKTNPEATICYILRLNVLGGVRRSAFWNTYPPSIIGVLRPRPSFSGDGKTDATEYAAFVWAYSQKYYRQKIAHIDAPRPKRVTSAH